MWYPAMRLALALVLTAPIGFALGNAHAQRPAQDALWDGAKAGDVAAVTKAIVDGADVNALDTRTNPNGRRALNWAAWFNHPAVIHLLVSKGAKLDLANATGFTALHHAAENGSLDAAKALLEAGADPRVKNGEGLTPLDVATARAQTAVAELLQKAALPKPAK